MFGTDSFVGLINRVMRAGAAGTEVPHPKRGTIKTHTNTQTHIWQFLPPALHTPYQSLAVEGDRRKGRGGGWLEEFLLKFTNKISQIKSEVEPGKICFI